MKKMTQQRLAAFHKKSNHLPANILFFRDGVDEGQYSRVQSFEVDGVKEGYRAFAKSIGTPQEPKITTVIVTKRHHTRFYPSNVFIADDEAARRSNCRPGTCVDSGVTHPNYFEFYLQSHNPLQGTARPARYFVLENGMGLTEQQLQEFTYELCYCYVLATLPVGYAPPAYYADRLCERARSYFADFLKAQDTAGNNSDNAGSKVKAMVEDEGQETETQSSAFQDGNVDRDVLLREIRDVLPDISEAYVRKLATNGMHDNVATSALRQSIIEQVLDAGQYPREEQLELGGPALSDFEGPNKEMLRKLDVETRKRLAGMLPDSNVAPESQLPANLQAANSTQGQTPQDASSATAKTSTEDAHVAESFEPTGKWKDRWDVPNNPNGPWHQNLNESMFWM